MENFNTNNQFNKVINICKQAFSVCIELGNFNLDITACYACNKIPHLCHSKNAKAAVTGLLG